MGFFGNVFNKVTSTIQASGDKRRAARQKRLETRQGGKTDRALVDAESLSQRSAIAAQSGFDPATIPSNSGGGGGKLASFLGNAKDFLGNFIGGNQATAQASTGEPPKDNKIMIIAIVGVVVAAILAFIGLRPKKKK